MPPVPVRVSRVNMVRLALMGLVVVDRLNGLQHLQGCGVQVWQRARVRVDGHLSLLLPLFCSDLPCFRQRLAVFCSIQTDRSVCEEAQ